MGVFQEPEKALQGLSRLEAAGWSHQVLSMCGCREKNNMICLWLYGSSILSTPLAIYTNTTHKHIKTNVSITLLGCASKCLAVSPFMCPGPFVPTHRTPRANKKLRSDGSLNHVSLNNAWISISLHRGCLLPRSKMFFMFTPWRACKGKRKVSCEQYEAALQKVSTRFISSN